MTKVAIVGVKQSMGRELLNILNEKGVAPDDIIALEPKATLGTVVSYGEEDELDVTGLERFEFVDADVVFFADTKEIAKRYIKKAADAGCKVIDMTGATFTDAAVPMIIPEYNGDLLKDKNLNTVAIPSSVVYQILLPLTEILKSHHLKRLVMTVFNSTSYYGHDAMEELFSQSRKIYTNETLADDQTVFKKQIAFNVLPQVGEFIGDETELEWAINAEIKKVLHEEIKVHANCAFVPTFIGDAVYVNAEFDDEVDADELREQMKAVKNVVVFDKNVDGGYVSVEDIQGEESVYISRVRQDVSVENGISFWTVMDNLRAGSARPAMTIMEDLLS